MTQQLHSRHILKRNEGMDKNLYVNIYSITSNRQKTET